MTLSLGIEGTAHTLGVGIVNEKGEIIANVKLTYTPKIGGINPSESMRFMRDHGSDAVKSALEEMKSKGYSIRDIAVVSYSRGPGLSFVP